MTTSTADDMEKARAKPAMARRRSRFFRFLVGATIAAHLPVLAAMAELFRRAGAPAPWLLGAAWAALGVVLFAGRARAGMPDRRRSEAVVRLVDIPYFIHWCAAVWGFIPSVLATLVAPLVDLARGLPVRLPMAFYAGAYVSGLVACGYGVLVRRRWLRVATHEVRIAGLDRRLDGVRIAQLSDLHIGTFSPRSWGLRWARAANAREPDLAVVTGDMVTSGVAFHEDVADVVGALRASRGVHVAMGNHDYFGEGEPLITLLRERGVRVLRNEGVAVERDGATLWLAAIDDTWTRRNDLARALRHRPPGAATVLLAHDPDRFDEAADAGVELVLSGHTHGGQIALPFFSRFLGLSHLTHKYRLGFYRRGRSTLFVSPGLGTTGPPMRLGVAPEVTILVLRAA